MEGRSERPGQTSQVPTHHRGPVQQSEALDSNSPLPIHQSPPPLPLTTAALDHGSCYDYSANAIADTPAVLAMV